MSRLLSRLAFVSAVFAASVGAASIASARGGDEPDNVIMYLTAWGDPAHPETSVDWACEFYNHRVLTVRYEGGEAVTAWKPVEVPNGSLSGLIAEAMTEPFVFEGDPECGGPTVLLSVRDGRWDNERLYTRGVLPSPNTTTACTRFARGLRKGPATDALLQLTKDLCPAPL